MGRVDTERGPESVYEVDGSGARRNRRVEGAQGDHENTLLLVGRVSGQVRLYRERGRGGGRETETSTKIIEGSQERRRYFFRWSGWYGKTALKTSRSLGGDRLLRPSTHTRAKYQHPHRSRRQTLKHRDYGQNTRGSMAPAASQLYGQRQVTTGATGGGWQLNEKRTERRQKEEREMHVRANSLETWSLGREISEGGERG